MEPLKMMILDMSISDAPPSQPSCPPTVLLYGVTCDDRRICCSVSDFLPYFWFPAPSFSSREELEGKLQLITDLLNHGIASITSRQKPVHSTPIVADISFEFRMPLMYYRPGGPFPFLKINVWKSKMVPLLAKHMSSIVGRPEFADNGLVWRDLTCYEEAIKLNMRFCCDTNIAGGAWVEIQKSQPVAERRTRCDEEVQASWIDLKGLTPDAISDIDIAVPAALVLDTDSESDEEFPKPTLVTARSKPVSRDNVSSLAPLKVLTIHVLCGSGDDSGTSKETLMESGVCDIEALAANSSGRAASSSRDPVLLISNILQLADGHCSKYVFIHGKCKLKADPGIEVLVFSSEPEMLLAWQNFVCSVADPDIICLYQLKDSLKYLVARFKVLKLGALEIGRLKGQVTKVKSVVTYGKNWVKQQARMTATSNQEVFRAFVEGRVVIDMLRVILVAHNLSTFTLAECSEVLLGKTKEVLSVNGVSKLWEDEAGRKRLINYSLQEARTALELMERLQALSETVEMARATGLSISDICYKAQMIRVQSLLLRASCKEGWLLGGATLGGQLSESPFLLHPKEHKTAGHYEDPVCVLDFASLYPSVYMAYNLCYTTLVHPEDVKQLSAEDIFRSPTGAHFVKKHVRHGILPRICGALIRARKKARDRLSSEDVHSDEKLVLDGRQKALKLCSNALYGFTGAGASPQQALALADSCLSIGAESCGRAASLVESSFDMAKVIYAQTDSVFVRLSGLSVDEALPLGRKISETVSKEFPEPMSLKFERVLCPFLLLQVNRYAGKQYLSTSQNELNGTLFVRGLESDRRDVPFFVRRACKSALTDILVERDIKAALDGCKRAISELVSGKLSMFELLLTGGLWRVDDNDITRLAAGAKSPRKTTTAEEGRGPHVALAVKLKRKHPERQFHIGERIPYVLVARSNSKLQDDMAEDPVTAMAEDLPINTGVYLENKLRKPLESILEHVAVASEVRELFNVSHQSSISANRASVSSFFLKKSSCWACRKPLDEDAVLCDACSQCDRTKQNMAAVVMSQTREEQRRFAAHSECLSCHSGGFTGDILCVNTDCPVFYLRYECKRLDHLESLLAKLSTAS